MKGCLFCKIYEEKSEVIYENNTFYSRFDMFTIIPGHTEIVPKKHIVSLTDLTKEEWADLKPAIDDTIEIIKEANKSGRLKGYYQSLITNPLNEQSKRYCVQMIEHIGINKLPDAYNHGINNGEAAGRTIHHLHWHVIPRYKGDVENPRGGVRHIIPGKGNYWKNNKLFIKSKIINIMVKEYKIKAKELIYPLAWSFMYDNRTMNGVNSDEVSNRSDFLMFYHAAYTTALIVGVTPAVGFLEKILM